MRARCGGALDQLFSVFSQLVRCLVPPARGESGLLWLTETICQLRLV